MKLSCLLLFPQPLEIVSVDDFTHSHRTTTTTDYDDISALPQHGTSSSTNPRCRATGDTFKPSGGKRHELSLRCGQHSRETNLLCSVVIMCASDLSRYRPDAV